MIQYALKAIEDDVNAFFKQRRGNSMDTMVLSSLSGAQEGNSPSSENKIYLFLTRISEEFNVPTNGYRRTSSGEMQQVNEPAHLCLHIMLAAVFKDYPTGLQVLSEVIGYLNGKLLFTRDNTPSMHKDLERFVLKMVTLDYSQQSLLWGTLGAKYSPSVIYSLRLLSVGEPKIKAVHAPVNQPNPAGAPV